jgi:hypothetical protein
MRLNVLDTSRPPIDCLGEPPIALVPLFHMSNWVAWRYVKKDGKRTKVPFNAYEPSRHAKPNDPSTWATSKAALEALHSGEADGIGFMLHGTRYAAIDLDNCLDATRPLHGRRNYSMRPTSWALMLR